MSTKVNEKSFWNYYIFFPGEAPTREQADIYQRRSIILAICTLGVVHLGYAIAYCYKKLYDRACHPLPEKLEPVASRVGGAASTAFSSPVPENAFATGKIAIFHRETSVIGSGRLLKDYHQKIELCDGTKWRDNPGDFLVMCRIEGLTKSIPDLKTEEILLPGCLFYTTDNEFKLKQKGDLISFLYDGKRLDLQASDAKIKEGSEEQVLPFTGNLRLLYDKCYVTQQGEDRAPVLFKALQNESTRYPAPHLVFDKQRKDAFFQKIKRSLPFLELGSDPREPVVDIITTSDTTRLRFEMPGVQQSKIKVLQLPEGSYVVYAPKETILGRTSFGTSYVFLMDKSAYPTLDQLDDSQPQFQLIAAGVFEWVIPRWPSII